MCFPELRSLHCISAFLCLLAASKRFTNTILRKRDWSHLLFAPLSTVFVVVWSLFSEIESTSAAILDFWHTRRRTFLASSLAYYPNSVAGFRLIRLLSCGDISPNLGPAPNCDKYVCSVCCRSVAHNHRAIQCDVCLYWCHIKCGKVTPAEYTKLASLTVSFPWSCPTFVITTSKNLPFSDIRNPSPGLDLSSDADTSILYESSDSINIVHVQPTPSPNSSLSTCQLPAPQDTKVSSGLKGRIINCNGLKGPSRFTEFLVLLDFHKPDIIVGSESKLDWGPTYSVFLPTYSVFTKDRNRNRGGVFQTIESEIVCKDKPNFGKDCEILWSSVKIGNYKTLHLASCYRPPNSPQDVLEQFSDSFNCVFESSNHHRNIMAAGDFKLGDFDWSAEVPFANNSVASALPNRLLRITKDFLLTQHLKCVTRPTSGKTLDLLFSSYPKRHLCCPYYTWNEWSSGNPFSHKC